MAKHIPTTYEEQSDCSILLDGAEDSFKKLGECFDDVFDDKKTKVDVVGSLFGFGASLTKLAFNATGCAIKNVPKAVVAVADAKRDLVNAIEDEIRESQKQIKQDALDAKIEQLRLKA